MRLHPTVIEQVRQRLQIVDLFEPASLRRVGGEFLTRCPWHEDRRPSLSLNPSKNLAYCHVCARGTDAIGWWMEQQGLSFQEAVLQLAERLGITAEPIDAADRDRLQQERAERKRLYALRQTQRQTFAERLWRSEGAAALAYLQGRGLTPQTIRDWQLGWNGERVMVPLNDPQGRTVAFSGRLLNHQNDQPGGAPKYRNSRNDLLYQKSQLLFGLDRAREAINRSRQAVLVEGQFDVIRLAQTGLSNVLAVSGSNLTASMLQLLQQHCRIEQLLLCFDGDAAGASAADRAIAALQPQVLSSGLDLRILSLPAGQDPAELADQFQALLDRAISWIDHRLTRASAGLDLGDPATIQRCEQELQALLKQLPAGGLRAYVLRRASALLSSDLNSTGLEAIPPAPAPATSRQLAGLPATAEANRSDNPAGSRLTGSSRGGIDHQRWAERRALRLYIHDPSQRAALQAIRYREPLLAEIQQVIETVEAMGGGGTGLRGLLMGLIQPLIGQNRRALAEAIAALCRPPEEVLRVIRANPLGELEGALQLLKRGPEPEGAEAQTTAPCSTSDS
ncbi:DNA primase [Synechococcus sp. WH 8101]|uniref:DNA primase n=1 Tax=Synechococcus sp. WH 8101 TaxID=59932 RepID=UPI0010231A16|nr:CHC2 zinc finger domain-containing protein [Synechococcus sp. WH 8101]QBE68881.1 DNA primase [Synechococcus sp. WH 8101]QNI45108.1 DNA primase catalytic core/ N-terminal domain protein [Synechococcus sp. WH 8101]